MAGIVEGLQYFNKKYDVLIVSSATEFLNCLDDKQVWLKEHFPFISWRQLIFCGKKDSIRGNIMIDDHPKNLSYFQGERYIFTQPLNINIENSTYHRVYNWEEIMENLQHSIISNPAGTLFHSFIWGCLKSQNISLRIGYLISVSNRDTNKLRVPKTFWTPSSVYQIF